MAVSVEQAIVAAFTELRSSASMKQEWDENEDENCFVSLKMIVVLKMFEADRRLSLSLIGDKVYLVLSPGMHQAIGGWNLWDGRIWEALKIVRACNDSPQFSF